MFVGFRAFGIGAGALDFDAILEGEVNDLVGRESISGVQSCLFWAGGLER
jgi:hypothetical protein